MLSRNTSGADRSDQVRTPVSKSGRAEEWDEDDDFEEDAELDLDEEEEEEEDDDEDWEAFEEGFEDEEPHPRHRQESDWR